MDDLKAGHISPNVMAQRVVEIVAPRYENGQPKRAAYLFDGKEIRMLKSRFSAVVLGNL